jgi:spore maturation protein CgeB
VAVPCGTNASIEEKRRVKLLIFGLAISSSWGNGHATLWRGLCSSLIRRGHRVLFFERDVDYYARHRDLAELPPGGRLVLYRDWPDVLPLARRELADADAAIVTSYCPDGVAATGLILDSTVPMRAFYDLDTPVTLARLAAGEEVAYLGPGGLGGFDLVLSYTGGRALEELRDRLGARRTAALYGSVDPGVHRPVPPDPGYRADLSYLGTFAVDRQAALEELFIGPARRLPEHRFVLGGACYPADFPWTKNIFFVRHLPPVEHPAFFSSSRLTLNVTRAAMATMGYCPSGRLFEAAACGTPVLSDVWEDLDSFFAPGREILLARDGTDVEAALGMDDGELHRIGRAARERVLEEHTADRRAEELVELLGGSPARDVEAVPRPGVPAVLGAGA